jgi:hypothetical protein
MLSHRAAGEGRGGTAERREYCSWSRSRHPHSSREEAPSRSFGWPDGPGDRNQLHQFVRTLSNPLMASRRAFNLSSSNTTSSSSSSSTVLSRNSLILLANIKLSPTSPQARSHRACRTVMIPPQAAFMPDRMVPSQLPSPQTLAQMLSSTRAENQQSASSRRHSGCGQF